MTFKKLWKNEYIKTLILLAIVILGVLAFWFGIRLALKTEFPVLAVASGSMHPTLEVGDLIIIQGGLKGEEIKAAPKNAPVPGDIIVFDRVRLAPFQAGELYVHRAIDRTQDPTTGKWYFRTQGDYNSGADHWYDEDGNLLPYNGMIPEDYIVGKVIYKIPWLGNVALFLRSSGGIFLIIILFIFIILIEFILPVLFKKPKEKEILETAETDKPSAT
ncbi:MAG: signal peptidase I [Candidatus Bathyarchaeia archaeon]